MRLPNSCPSDSESGDEYPETNDRYQNDEDDENIISPSNNRMNFAFRNIRRGSTVDCQDDDGYWYAAEVKKLDKRDQKLYISFTNSGDIFDKWIIFDRRVARLNTHTYDNNGNFKIGQMIEFLDGTGIWKKGTITAVSAEQNRVQVSSSLDRVSWWVSSPRNNIRALQRQAVPIPRNFRRWKVPSSTGWYHNPNHNNNNNNSPLENANNITSTTISNITVTTIDTKDPTHTRKIAEFSDRYSQYIQALEKSGLSVIQVNGDGNCLFRAVAHQIYGDEELHSFVREYCMNYMEADSKFFSQFVEGGEASFGQYLAAKRCNACWGDDPEIQALCEIYDRPAEIWAYDNTVGARKLRTFHEAAINSHDTSSNSGISNSSSSGVQHQDTAHSSITHTNHSRRDSNSNTTTTNNNTNNNSILTPRPLIKLSYYGGGHYDSLIDNDHNQSFQLNLVPSQLVGKIENAAIARCGHRIGGVDVNNLNRNPILSSSNSTTTTTTTGNNSHSHSNRNNDSDGLEQAKKLTDAEATERAALDMAIQISRHDHLGWAMSEDMDACLLMALDMPFTQQQPQQQLSSSLLSSTSSSSSSSSNYMINMNNTNNSNNTTKNSPQQQQLSLEHLADATADLIAVQQDLIKSVTEQSEREYLEKAILSSLTADTTITPPTSTTTTTIAGVTGVIADATSSPSSSSAAAITGVTSIEEDSKLIEEQFIEQARLASMHEMLSKTDNNHNNQQYQQQEQQPQQFFDADAYSKSLEVAEATKWSDWCEEDVVKLTVEKSIQEHKLLLLQQQQQQQYQQQQQQQQQQYQQQQQQQQQQYQQQQQQQKYQQQQQQQRGGINVPPQLANNNNRVTNNNTQDNTNTTKAKAAVVAALNNSDEQVVEIELDEEAMLEAAIRESLLTSSSSIRSSGDANGGDVVNYGAIKSHGSHNAAAASGGDGVGAARLSNHNNNNNSNDYHEYYHIGDEEDEDLSRAIADSLRHLQ